MSRTIIVVVTRHSLPFAERMLPSTDRIARGADRAYFFYPSSCDESMCAPEDFVDPLDGELLLAIRQFDTLSEAEAWAVGDARQRHLMLATEDTRA